ncbi:NCS1 family nucleobase:cation symporter-1 [Umbelopsis sp. PMI_123]|nr:NCS1 family nucleobase:cation symporter-1 [Umbelopsis sp. PMI_123]
MDPEKSYDFKDEEVVSNGSGSSETASAEENALHIEIQGIKPVPDTHRTHTRISDNFTMWFSVNTTLANLAIGTLAIPIFGLGFWDSFSVILVCNAIAVAPGAFFVTFGPRYGMRQMILSRYSFGIYGGILAALVNVVVCVGWSVINSILAAQLLTSVSNGKLPVWAAILILSFITVIIAIFGYRIVHHYERFSWLPMWIIFFIILGEAAHHMTYTPITATGATEAGNWLSFAASVVGYNPGWVTCAADYSVNQPSSFDRRVVFILAFLGSYIPSVLLQTLGVGLTTGFPSNPSWADAFDSNSTGGLIGEVLSPLGGFGKFLLVLLALGIIACNVPNGYSVALSFQTISTTLVKIPQWAWTIVGCIVYTIIACFGANHFSDILENFLLILAYYAAPYTMVIIIEHGVFRRDGIYNVEDWNNQKKLPIGVAAVGAVLIGFAFAMLGMNQVWFVGPFAKKIGEYGGDIGFELAIAFSTLSYLVLRPIERRLVGR